MVNVLLVDDDPNQLEARRLVFEAAGHTVSVARSAREAAACLDSRINVLLMDLRLPRTEDGVALIRRAHEDWPAMRIIVLSGWPDDLAERPEASMVDRLLSKPVRSRQLLGFVSRLMLVLLCLVCNMPAGVNPNGYPFQLDEPAEVVGEFDLSAPGTDWGREGREAVLAVVTVDGTEKQHIMLYAGSNRHRYAVFLGHQAAGAHTVKIERHPDWSARGASLEVHDVSWKQFKPTDPGYDLISNAPVLFARANTIAKFTDIPLLVYCERLGDGSLRYTVIFSNEDGGTSTRALMARWGRATDIEHVYQVWPGKDGKPARTLIQARGHNDVPYQGTYEGLHPLLGVVTDNNMVGENAPSPVRYQIAPTLVDLSNASREEVMDLNPFTYLISARELEREGKLRTYGTVDGSKISAPENYLFAELHILNKDSRLAMFVRLENERVFRTSHLSFPAMAIERSGWVRTTVELPPATQPPQVAEIGFYCLPAEKSEGGGSCRVEAIRKLFFLDASQVPSESFWRPLVDRGPWIIPAGQLRVVPLR